MAAATATATEVLYKGFGSAPETAVSAPNSAHVFTGEPQPHIARRKALQAKYGDLIERLSVKRPDSALWVWGCVGLQVVVAAVLSATAAPWWATLIVAYCVGAVADHALWVLIHDLTHDAVFASTWWNNAYHCVANLPIIFPSAISFKYFHQQHHSHLNEAYGDPDIPSPLENWVFGTTPVGKATWLLLFALVQPLRTLRYKPTLGGLEKWAAANWIVQLGFNYAVYRFLGLHALLYLAISSIFAIGLHPLGARWIAEHYSVHPSQETYSHYGWANFLMLNVGYHNEHHDLPSVPWQHLPLLKSGAPEFYSSLWYHTSYTRLLWDFVTSPAFTLESRIVRRPRIPSYLKNDSVTADADAKTAASGGEVASDKGATTAAAPASRGGRKSPASDSKKRA